MNAPNLLVLPQELNYVHDRMHSVEPARTAKSFTWLPVTLHENLASIEARQSAERYFSERSTLERQAKWAGVQRNAKRLSPLKKAWALCLGYIRYEYGVQRARRTAALVGLVLTLASVGLFIGLNPNMITATRGQLPELHIEEAVHAAAVAISDATRPKGAPSTSQAAIVAATKPLPISDPKPLTDIGAEPGLPLKLSCVFPTETELKLKAKP